MVRRIVLRVTVPDPTLPGRIAPILISQILISQMLMSQMLDVLLCNAAPGCVCDV